jgi:hypothetical protein
MNSRHHRIEAIAPWAGGLLLALPTLVAFYPPMSDLPYHEAAIGILRHFHDASMFPPGLYRLNLGETNQLFHMIGWLLSYVVSTRWAIKLIVAATVVAIPVCAARLARHVGASPLAALLVAPMAVGWLFYWGLIANLIGLAALLAVLPALDRFAQKPTTRGALGTLGAVVLLYFAHEAMMFVYGGMSLLLAVLHPWSPKRTVARLAPFAAVVVVHEAFIHWVQQFATPASRAMPVFWSSQAQKLKNIPNMISPASDRPVLVAMSTLCGLTIAGLFWLRTRERRAAANSADRTSAAPLRTWLRLDLTSAAAWAWSKRVLKVPSVEHLRSWAFAQRWELLVATCFGAYLAFPLSLSGTTFVYHRWFPPGFAILAVCAAPRSLLVRPARVALAALVALPVATLLIAWPSFADSSRAYVALEPLLAQVELGSAVAGLDLGPGDPSRTYSLGPACGRILATRGGRLVYAFTDSAISPVIIPRRYWWTESLVRVGFDSYAFRPEQDLRRFRYLLVRANDPMLAMLAIRALEVEAEYVTGAQEWMLFKSRLPTVPLLSRDQRIEGPPSESMRERIDALFASMRDARKADMADKAAACPAR